MNGIKYSYINFILINVFFLFLFYKEIKGQQFVNQNLEGPQNFGPPPGWQKVPFTDVNSVATDATADNPSTLIDSEFPGSLPTGLLGTPFCGNSFVSGRHISHNVVLFPSGLTVLFIQEGIMQTVSGFTIGTSYTINFHQAVVKEQLGLDSQGSWQVYLDNTLIATTQPTFSNAPFNSTSFIWENRNVTFTASATQHTIKFLPIDDDANISDALGLRMGIDNIYLSKITNLNLGSDTTLCNGDSLILNADMGTSTSSYLWQDGNTDSNFVVTQGGTYFVDVTNNCEVISDTIIVNFDPELPNSIDLGNDTILCQGDSLILNTGISDPSYSFLWHDNSTDSTFLVHEQGTYFVSITNACSTISDTITANFSSTPSLNLGNDTSLCDGNSITLDANFGDPNASYLWQDSSTNSNFIVSQQGTYFVNIENICGIVIDSIIIIENSVPNINLGNDTSICEGDFLVLDASFPNSSYLWQDDSFDSTFNVSQSGVYSVTVSNSCGVTSDQITVYSQECCNLYIPNSFTPNNDNINDLFSPFSDCLLTEFNLTIFDHWGNVLFNTNNLNTQWNGTSNNLTLPSGIYSYKATYTSKNNNTTKYGHISLIR